MRARLHRQLALRNRALFAILYRTGLRIAEALVLFPKDVDLERGAIRVLHGKGDKARVVGVDRGALAILERWLDVRACCGHGASRTIFCTSSGQRPTRGYVRRWLPTLGRRAGVAKRVHAHGLRHTHAAQLREEGMDIGVISKRLGHSSISTTAHYLDHVAPWAVVDQIAGRLWTHLSAVRSALGGCRVSAQSRGVVVCRESLDPPA